MNEQEKSLKLAELMGWKLHLGTGWLGARPTQANILDEILRFNGVKI